MTSKLARWSWVLALPLSAVLAAPTERAVEVPLKANGMSAMRSTTTTHSAVNRRSGKIAKRQATPVKEHNLSMRDVSPAGPDNDGVYHSVHDWVPSTPTKVADNQAQAEESNHAQRVHWWSRPKNVASSKKAEEVKP